MTQLDLSGRRVGITGGDGFLGKHLCQRLRKRECETLLIPRRSEYDFTEQEDVRRWYRDEQPEIVFHLAAEVGGIGANQKHPGRFFYANAAMGIHLIEEARRVGVEKFVQVGTICAYPKFAPTPFREDEIWNGYPEETNAPYGIAKKSLLVMSQSYRQEYGFDCIYLLPVNLYGPKDNFDLQSSHVIPALIRKCLEAKQANRPSIVCWGSGKISREFLYVDDCAEGLICAAERYSGSEPINLGTGREIRISELVELIARLCDYQGQIEWDATKPDGQPRRCLDVERAKNLINFEAQMSLEDGLKQTIAWYTQEMSKVKLNDPTAETSN
ncbi:MAG: GDP-L-fucose synthase [Candidatus Hinthialibacter antarcticus]|nr:GDP-L-fucose synthase [Candidatus Hinthialibacter antarcticus]